MSRSCWAGSGPCTTTVAGRADESKKVPIFMGDALEGNVVVRHNEVIWRRRRGGPGAATLWRGSDTDAVHALTVEVGLVGVQHDPLAAPLVRLVRAEDFRDGIRVGLVQDQALVLAGEVQYRLFLL